MAQQVDEIMAPDLFAVGPQEPRETALLSILALAITAAPVVDEQDRPLGVISLRDLVGPQGTHTVGERMTSPAVVVDEKAGIEEAGRKLSDANVHHLIVTGSGGRATGVVSSMDVVRGLLGIPATHPPAFRRTDALGHEWSEPAPLDLEHAGAAPTESGLFVIIHGGAHQPETPVWAETTANLKDRLQRLAVKSDLGREAPQLSYLLGHEHEHLRFRAAAVGDLQERLEALLDARRNLHPPE